jgi:hypothetical protein
VAGRISKNEKKKKKSMTLSGIDHGVLRKIRA